MVEQVQRDILAALDARIADRPAIRDLLAAEVTLLVARQASGRADPLTTRDAERLTQRITERIMAQLVQEASHPAAAAAALLVAEQAGLDLAALTDTLTDTVIAVLQHNRAALAAKIDAADTGTPFL